MTMGNNDKIVEPLLAQVKETSSPTWKAGKSAQ